MANCDAKNRLVYDKETAARIRRRLMIESLYSKRNRKNCKTIQEILLEELRDEEKEQLVSQHKGDK